MVISMNLVKDLREKTQAGIMDCKRALESSDGDIERAVIILREKGLAQAKKKSSRVTKEGLVESYIHGEGKIGVLVEVNCETDFVARNPEFKELVSDISMQIAASNPLYIDSREVPESIIEKEREIYTKEAKSSGKPDKIITNFVNGKLQKYYKEVCLLCQPFVKDPEKSVQDYLTEKIAKFGENIIVKRFARFQLGDES